MTFKCGKCAACRRRRVLEWWFRLYREQRDSLCSHFVTLTYDRDNCPVSNNGRLTLNHRDLQGFFKRLRKVNKDKIRYYAIGEYGGRTQRPHYHIILFNLDEVDEGLAWKKLTKVWKKGLVHVGTVTDRSIKYVTGYVNKEVIIPQYKGDDRDKEFCRMSKGIGKGYLKESIKRWHKEPEKIGQRIYAMIQGKKLPLSRYYKDKIYDKIEKDVLMSLELEKRADMTEEEIEQERTSLEVLENRKSTRYTTI